MSKEFQRTHSVLFLRYIELRTKTVTVTRLSSKILLSFVIVKSPKLNPVNRPKRAVNESHRNRWKRIIKSLGYSKNIRSFHWNEQTMKVLPPFWIWQCHVVVRRPIRHFSPVKAKHSWTALRMSRPLFVGSYLQVT